MERFIGLMTGTSLDNIDAVLVEFAGGTPRLAHQHQQPLPDALREQCLALTRPGHDEIARMMSCDRALGMLYAEAVQSLLAQASITPDAIRAIGCHGQTLRHHPRHETATSAWTLQIGDPATLAIATGIDVVADFRRQDIAAGGQGAPLAPGFHAAVFHSPAEDRVILNLGGIANISVLPAAGTASGFDTGPANSLMDIWVHQSRGLPYDAEGTWARSGTIHNELVEHWIGETSWFAALPPKSTGREVFGQHWIDTHRHALQSLPAADAQASLAEFSAVTIAQAIALTAPRSRVYACGGGVRNTFLMERLALHMGRAIGTTSLLGIDPQAVEAMAFAWLAHQRVHGLPGNLPAVTGASRPLVLGALYCAR